MKKYKKMECPKCGSDMVRGERELHFQPYFHCSHCGRYFDLVGKERMLNEIELLRT